MSAEIKNTQYYPALDGLRGLAILLVVFLHNFGFMNYFFFGWLGVDLFFVLSGFLITTILLNTLSKPNFLKNFYIRRILRIFPLYYLLLLLSLFIVPLFADIEVSYYKESQGWLWSYLQNWLFIFKEPYGDKIVLHTWSLAVEEQFYLVWPLVVLFIKKPKILIWVMTTTLVITGITRYLIWSYKIEDLAYSSLYTFTRIDGLCIGSIVALSMKINPEMLKKFKPFVILLAALLNFGFYFINDSHSFTLPYLAFVGYTTFAVLFGILIYEAVIGESVIIMRIFKLRILGFFGKISYGLYVYHWPVYLLLFQPIKNWLVGMGFKERNFTDLPSAIAVTLLAVAISSISYRFFEKPILNLKRHFI